MKLIPSNRKDWFGTPAIALAVGHLFIASMVYSQQYEGSWGFIFLAIPDLPVFLGALLFEQLLSYQGMWYVVIGFGSAWWFLIGWWATQLFQKRMANESEPN